MITEVRVKNTAQNLPTIFALCLLSESRQLAVFVFLIQALICNSNSHPLQNQVRSDFNLNIREERFLPDLPHFNLLVFLRYSLRFPQGASQQSAV